MAEQKEPEKQEKRLAGIFFDLEKMEKALDEIMRNLVSEEEMHSGAPIKLDFSMKISPEGDVAIEGTNAARKQQLQAIEPLTEISEQAETIIITAEMPGALEKDIAIRFLEKNSLEITASGEKNFYKKILLEKPFKSSLKKSFRNNVLELQLEKK
ncbi:MAG TPA: Hsp20/alpha crystallin family protein [archaeon]|nr:Hsp20/alpha crystallin family protein [archaeon]